MNHNRAQFPISSALWCWSGVNDPRNATTGLWGDIASCAVPKTEGQVPDGLLQSMDTEQVYLWLLHINRDEGVRKLGGNGWIASRAGNFSVEEVFAVFHLLKLKILMGKCKPSEDFFWWDMVRRWRVCSGTFSPCQSIYLDQNGFSHN